MIEESHEHHPAPASVGVGSKEWLAALAENLDMQASLNNASCLSAEKKTDEMRYAYKTAYFVLTGMAAAIRVTLHEAANEKGEPR